MIENCYLHWEVSHDQGALEEALEEASEEAFHHQAACR